MLARIKFKILFLSDNFWWWLLVLTWNSWRVTKSNLKSDESTHFGARNVWEPYTTLPCSSLCTRNAGSALLATRLLREIGPLAVNRDRQTNETERRVAGNDATYEEWLQICKRPFRLFLDDAICSTYIHTTQISRWWGINR